MTKAGEILAREIARGGPVPFSQFMETALYAEGAGYYRRARDPFGKGGDFYTAAQVQPVFGRLVARVMEGFAPARILDWGSGRGEMREGLSRVGDYVPVERGEEAPAAVEGTAIFANELFDALPVDAARRDGGGWREMRVGFREGRFEWVEGAPLEGEWLEYAREADRHLPEEESVWLELPVCYGGVLGQMAAAAPRGHLLVIDYGYTAREMLRFPRGTLMGYHGHRSMDDVLSSPGEQDITAHVAWARMESEAKKQGWRKVGFESLASLLLRAGAADKFESALAGEREKHAGQLKTLLFGMGESFQSMMFEREQRAQQKANGPACAGPSG